MISVLILLIYDFWSVLVCNSLKSLGGPPGLLFSGRDVIP